LVRTQAVQARRDRHGVSDITRTRAPLHVLPTYSIPVVIERQKTGLPLIETGNEDQKQKELCPATRTHTCTYGSSGTARRRGKLGWRALALGCSGAGLFNIGIGPAPSFPPWPCAIPRPRASCLLSPCLCPMRHVHVHQPLVALADRRRRLGAHLLVAPSAVQGPTYATISLTLDGVPAGRSAGRLDVLGVLGCLFGSGVAEHPGARQRNVAGGPGTVGRLVFFFGGFGDPPGISSVGSSGFLVADRHTAVLTSRPAGTRACPASRRSRRPP
jgi:hypothetical protein